MSTLLPILQTTPASLCDTCPEPGRCCKQFCLPAAPSFWLKSWREDAQKWLDDNGLPFAPHSHSKRIVRDRESGDDYVLVWFGCNHLTPEGRCGMYETRPETCRIFEPASDSLCVLHPDAPLAYSRDPSTEWPGQQPDVSVSQ